MDDIYEIALDIRCAYCGAASGEPCRTKSLVLSWYPHAARMHPTRNIFRRGWEGGIAEAVSARQMADEGKSGYWNRLVAQAEKLDSQSTDQEATR